MRPHSAVELLPALALVLVLPLYAQPPRPPAGGPYRHKVLSASSKDGLTWTRDPGVRIEHASVPAAVTDGKRVVLYYVDADRGPGQFESVGCAISTDGVRFEKQPFTIDGMTSRKAVDPSILRDADGNYRLYYLAASGPGDPAGQAGDHEIHLALSTDGVRFTNAGAAFKYPSLVDPDVFQYRDQWLMYVFGGRRGTLIASSADGRRFEYKQVLDLPGWGTVSPVKLDDGRLRLYAFDQRTREGNTVRSFLSTNGIDWTAEPGDRLKASAGEQITDPYVIRWQGGYKMYFKTDEPQARMERPSAEGRPGPWDQDLLVFRVSNDKVVKQVATFPRAGVPTLARLKDGRLIAANQHFPENNRADFDKVAVRFSKDEGDTWSDPLVIQVTGLPEGMRFPFDPTLVTLDDGRLRLYFTSNHLRPTDGEVEAIYSAISADGIHYTVEPGMRFGIPGRRVIDCAVALHDGVFHLYSPDNGERGRKPQPGVGYHATSRDGLEFTRVADVKIEGERRWLGNVFSDRGALVFFGSGGPQQRGIWTAISSDGQSWKLVDVGNIPGADPAAASTTDSGGIVISTGPPRPGTPSDRRQRSRN